MSERNRAARTELAGLVQVPRLAWHLPGLLVAPRGHRAPVLVLPGRSTSDASTLPLRSYLRALGHHPRGWGLGQNHGRVAELIPPVVDQVRALAAAAGRPVPLVGQSLGGYVAREVARRLPDEVEQVITLGTPIFAARSAGSITCPVTAIYSRTDQVVSTSRSIDTDPSTTNVEVSSPHFTMGLDPDVWRIVARALHEPVAAR